MPKDKDLGDMTVAEAKANVDKHIKAHGEQMKTPVGKGDHDNPTQAELDADPDWFKQGKPRPPHPDD